MKNCVNYVAFIIFYDIIHLSAEEKAFLIIIFKEKNMNTDYDNINNENGKPKKDIKNRIRISILVFIVLTFIVNSLILADAIHTKYVTYQALGSFTDTESTDKRAKMQGNLGNFNIASKKNSLSQNKDKTYTLTLELDFTNYGETGRSFDEAVGVVAYQNDKQIFGFDLEATDESNVKVRNGQKTNVVLVYVIKDITQDVKVDMVSGNNEFTYTVKLSQPSSQKKETVQAETTTEAATKE